MKCALFLSTERQSMQPVLSAEQQSRQRRSGEVGGEAVKRCTIIISNNVLMKLPTSLCPLHLAVIPKLNLRRQTVNWREVIEITFWSWNLSLTGITAWSASFCTLFSLPGVSSTVRTVVLIHWSKVVKG